MIADVASGCLQAEAMEADESVGRICLTLVDRADRRNKKRLQVSTVTDAHAIASRLQGVDIVIKTPEYVELWLG
jgi:hypothetical protein